MTPNPRDHLLGVTVEPDPWPQAPPDAWAARDDDGQILARGTRARCLRARLDHLEKLHGDGRVVLRTPTLGGKQVWADVFVACGWRIQLNLLLDGHHRLLDRDDRREAAGSYEACRVAFERARLTRGLRPRGHHAVVMLHGLIRAKDSMGPLAEHFAQAGYEVVNVNYPSTRRTIEEHAAQLHLILSRLPEIETVSLVTHSMGGMVVRTLLAIDGQGGWPTHLRLHRLLMIFPPSRGAIKAARFQNVPVVKQIMGPPLQELTPEQAPRIPLPSCRFAIIAGARDTTVQVEEALLPGAEATRVMDVEHTFGMGDPEVLRAALRYIDEGRL